MENQAFPVLPEAVQLHVFEKAGASDLNSLQLTCKQLRNLIKRYERTLYSRRLVKASIHLNERYDLIKVTIDFRRWSFTLMFGYGRCREVKIYATDNFHVLPYTMEILSGAFMNKSMQECLGNITERSGGFFPLNLSGRLTRTRFKDLRPIIGEAKYLVMDCILESIPPDLAFEVLFAPKRPLNLSGRMCTKRIINDSFCRYAGIDDLVLVSYEGHTVDLTDDDLMYLITRKDLKRLSITSLKVHSFDAIRCAIQELLESTIDCRLELTARTIGSLEATLWRMMGDERIELKRASQMNFGPRFRLRFGPVMEFRFFLNDRKVLVLVKKSWFGYDIVVQA